MVQLSVSYYLYQTQKLDKRASKIGTDQIMRFKFTFYRTPRALPPGRRLALSANEAQH